VRGRPSPGTFGADLSRFAGEVQRRIAGEVQRRLK
jgi:hypothetical protein